MKKQIVRPKKMDGRSLYFDVSSKDSSGVIVKIQKKDVYIPAGDFIDVTDRVILYLSLRTRLIRSVLMGDHTRTNSRSLNDLQKIIKKSKISKDLFAHRYFSYGDNFRIKEPDFASKKKVMSQRIFRFDKYKCVYCGVPLQFEELESPDMGTIDHVLPSSKGGDWFFYNTVSCCLSCNRKKGNRGYLNIVCKETSKITYASEDIARSLIPSKKSLVQYVHGCEHCGGWHISSGDKASIFCEGSSYKSFEDVLVDETVDRDSSVALDCPSCGNWHAVPKDHPELFYLGGLTRELTQNSEEINYWINKFEDE